MMRLPSRHMHSSTCPTPVFHLRSPEAGAMHNEYMSHPTPMFHLPSPEAGAMQKEYMSRSPSGMRSSSCAACSTLSWRQKK